MIDLIIQEEDVWCAEIDKIKTTAAESWEISKSEKCQEKANFRNIAENRDSLSLVSRI